MNTKQKSDKGFGNHWRTQPYIYDPLHKEFNFDFDPYPYKHDLDKWDALKIPWGKRNFVNPPYSSADKNASINRAIDEMLNNGAWSLFLIPATTDSKIFHEAIVPYASDVIFIKKRVRFSGFNTKGEYVTDRTGQSGSMLVIFDPNHPLEKSVNYSVRYFEIMPDTRPPLE